MVPIIIAAFALGLFDSSSSSSGSGSPAPKQPSPSGTPAKPSGAAGDWGTQLGRLLEGLGKGVGAVVEAADDDN